MKNNIILFVVLFVLLCTVVYAFAGHRPAAREKIALDGRDELRQLYRHAQGDRVNVSGVIQLFDAEHENALKERTPFSFIRQGDRLYYGLGPLKTFVSDSFAVELDTFNRQLIVSPAAAEDRPSSIFPFEALLADTSFHTVVHAEETDGLRVLTIESEQYPNIRACRLVYKPESYETTAAEIEFWKEGLITKESLAQKKFWLAKIQYDYSAEVPDLQRMTNAVLTVRDGHAEVGAAFKNYLLQTNF